MKKERSNTTLQWIPNYIAHTPLHLQLVKVFANKIGTRQLCSGDLFPPVADLSVASRIAPRIIREAYGELEKLGFIHCAHHCRFMLII